MKTLALIALAALSMSSGQWDGSEGYRMVHRSGMEINCFSTNSQYTPVEVRLGQGNTGSSYTVAVYSAEGRLTYRDIFNGTNEGGNQHFNVANDVSDPEAFKFLRAIDRGARINIMWISNGRIMERNESLAGISRAITDSYCKYAFD